MSKDLNYKNWRSQKIYNEIPQMFGIVMFLLFLLFLIIIIIINADNEEFVVETSFAAAGVAFILMILFSSLEDKSEEAYVNYMDEIENSRKHDEKIKQKFKRYNTK
jgi:uncharacterized membrane protein YbhN (UPF0104 family)